jgi:hypothetical protein
MERRQPYHRPQHHPGMNVIGAIDDAAGNPLFPPPRWGIRDPCGLAGDHGAPAPTAGLGDRRPPGGPAGSVPHRSDQGKVRAANRVPGERGHTRNAAALGMRRRCRSRHARCAVPSAGRPSAKHGRPPGVWRTRIGRLTRSSSGGHDAWRNRTHAPARCRRSTLEGLAPLRGSHGGLVSLPVEAPRQSRRGENPRRDRLPLDPSRSADDATHLQIDSQRAQMSLVV